MPGYQQPLPHWYVQANVVAAAYDNALLACSADFIAAAEDDSNYDDDGDYCDEEEPQSQSPELYQPQVVAYYEQRPQSPA